jgi:hypothetical protein
MFPLVLRNMAVKLGAATAAAEGHPPEQAEKESQRALATGAANVRGAALRAKQTFGVWFVL